MALVLVVANAPAGTSTLTLAPDAVTTTVWVA
jgi:hypothetical protein